MTIEELLTYLSESNTTEVENQLFNYIGQLRLALIEATPWLDEIANDPVISNLEFKSGTDLDIDLLLAKVRALTGVI